MKRKIFLVISFLCVLSLVLFACTPIQLSKGPKDSDTVYGNGGIAVVKGDYLYFSNAFLSFEQLGVNDNKYGKDNPQKIYGIYRTKLTDSGMVDLNDDGLPKGAELLVPNIAGYEYSGIYIYGEYLFYTTPFSSELSGSAEPVKGLVSFDRVKLDGSDHKVLYKTTSYSSDCSYKISSFNGYVYITIFDKNSNLRIVKIKNGNVSDYQLESSVKSYWVYEPKEIEYKSQVDDFYKYVYYTKMSSSNNYYSLHRRLIDGSKAEETFILSTPETLEIVEVKNNRLYYKQNDILKSYSFNLNEIPKTYTQNQIKSDASTEIVDYRILEDTKGYPLDRGIVAVYKETTNYILTIYNEGNQNVFPLKNSANQINLLYTESNNIYYQIQEDPNVYCLKFEYNPATNQVSTQTPFSVAVSINLKVNDGTKDIVDFDGERIYYFSKAKDSNEKLYYLHMIKVPNGYKDSDNQPCGQIIGILDDSDKK